MVTGKSLLRSLVLGAFVVILTGSGLIAQIEDPDPNSPTPVLLTVKDEPRVLTSVYTRTNSKLSSVRFDTTSYTAPNSRVLLYVSNLDLLPGEGANAFRVYANDPKGRLYRFPVLELRLVPEKPWLAVLVTRLTDELGYSEKPAPGDLMIYVAWRGIVSNQAKLGYGATGGIFSIEQKLKTAPLSSFMTQSSAKSAAADMQLQTIGYKWSGDRMRFLEQTTFGPTPALDQLVRRIGLRTWLAEQFDAPYPSAANPYPNQPLKPSNAPSDCDGEQTIVPDVPVTCFRDTYTMYPIQTWFMRENFYGDAQLRHRVGWALSQIWVTSGVDIQQSRHMVEYHKVLSANTFGNYRALMKQMTLNPTMGDYLDMARNTKNNPNENYAREIMQLFTIGLFMLNQDGTLQLDGQGNPIPTYDQNVVNNLTKVFTGWSFCQTQVSCPNVAVGTVNFIDPMLLSNGNHDLTAKTLLNYPGSTTTNIAACTGCTGTAIATYANNSLDQALDNIFNHPNVGPFVSRTLIQQLVTSDPTPAYVGRVAAVFNNNGFGVRGDLKAVIRAILLDPEARGDVKTDPNYGKLREPVQFATNLLRAFNVRSADGLSLSDGFITGRAEFTGMSQIPFQSPTVFNYYPPGYVIPNTTLNGPEFALMTTGTAIQRANFVNRFVFTAQPIAGTGDPTTNNPNGTSLDLSDLQAISASDGSGNQLLDALNQRMLHNTMSAQMRNTILTAVTSIAATDTLGRVRQAVYLVATSSQYQVQR